MRWALLVALGGILAAHPSNADELEGPEQRVEELKGVLNGAHDADLASDAHELRQVKNSETDAQECRRNHADQSTIYVDNPRLAAIYERRRCTLYDEVAKEKRKAYEQRRRIANQQKKH